jgi:hypothetical protein
MKFPHVKRTIRGGGARCLILSVACARSLTEGGEAAVEAASVVGQVMTRA